MAGKINNKTAVIVMGMHRSGTSSVAGFLYKFCDVYMNNNMLIAKNRFNSKGYYEYLESIRINNQLMKSKGTFWNNLKNDIDWTNVPQNLKKRMVQFINKIIVSGKNNNYFVFKDPRLSIVWPAWEPIFKEFFNEIKFVYVYRTPVDVARSLNTRDKMPLSTGLSLWRDYNDHIIKYINHYQIQTIIVKYDQLLITPKDEVTKILNFLNLNPVNDDKIKNWFRIRSTIKKNKKPFYKLSNDILKMRDYLNSISMLP